MLTVSLELAKKMKELGWGKRCYHRYSGDADPDAVIEYFRPLTEEEKKDNPDSVLVYDIVFLPTAQEILDELPAKFDDGDTLNERSIETGFFSGYTGVGGDKEWYACYVFDVSGKRDKKTQFIGATIAEALGQLRCWCKENNHL